MDMPATVPVGNVGTTLHGEEDMEVGSQPQVLRSGVAVPTAPATQATLQPPLAPSSHTSHDPLLERLARGMLDAMRRHQARQEEDLPPISAASFLKTAEAEYWQYLDECEQLWLACLQLPDGPASEGSFAAHEYEVAVGATRRLIRQCVDEYIAVMTAPDPTTWQQAATGIVQQYAQRVQAEFNELARRLARGAPAERAREALAALPTPGPSQTLRSVVERRKPLQGLHVPMLSRVLQQAVWQYHADKHQLGAAGATPDAWQEVHAAFHRRCQAAWEPFRLRLLSAPPPGSDLQERHAQHCTRFHTVVRTCCSLLDSIMETDGAGEGWEPQFNSALVRAAAEWDQEACAFAEWLRPPPPQP